MNTGNFGGGTGFRGRDEHRKLRLRDITIREEVDGTRYMMFEERDTKTRKNPSDMRTINPRLYETKDKPETCPVNLFLEYTHRRPLAMCHPDTPFYLQAHQSLNKGDPAVTDLFQMPAFRRAQHGEYNERHGSPGQSTWQKDQSFWTKDNCQKTERSQF